MNIEGYSEYGKQCLTEAAERFRGLNNNELITRIVVALDTQDSCDACWVKTMREKLLQGKCGLWTCDECTKEISSSEDSHRADTE